MLAHLSVLANLLTGFLGVVAALVIYLVFGPRSKYVAYHAWQSFIFQLVWWVGGGVLTGVAWSLVGVLSIVLVGILCIPIALAVTLMPLVACVYGIVGAVQTNRGEDFRYWLIGNWGFVRDKLTG